MAKLSVLFIGKVYSYSPKESGGTIKIPVNGKTRKNGQKNETIWFTGYVPESLIKAQPRLFENIEGKFVEVYLDFRSAFKSSINGIVVSIKATPENSFLVPQAFIANTAVRKKELSDTFCVANVPVDGMSWNKDKKIKEKTTTWMSVPLTTPFYNNIIGEGNLYYYINGALIVKVPEKAELNDYYWSIDPSTIKITNYRGEKGISVTKEEQEQQIPIEIVNLEEKDIGFDYDFSIPETTENENDLLDVFNNVLTY